ncbi:MAG: hypothetical protein Q7N95_06570 [Alphaproteobacteria bacterium]|nr:hypothetical protein [Alphaproteobacteria bacterium]
MRLLLASTAIALLFGLSPASAMCGSGGQAGAGGMCGAKPSANNMTEWPDAPKAQLEQKQSGMGGSMCGCCKNMAMMGGMKADDPHKGMNMPKQ